MASPQATVNINAGWLRSIAKMPIPEHSGIYKLHLQAKATIDSAGVRDSVKLPPGIDRDEWIASKLVALYEEVVQLVHLLEDICSDDSCPRMSAGKHVHYSWADETNPMPRALSAPEYMKMLATYAEERLSDRKVLPVDGSPLPPEFKDMALTLCKRFFRVYAHAYLSHFQMIQDHGAEGHLNCHFKHFLYFVIEFNLVEKRDMQPLADLIKQFLAADEKNDRKQKKEKAENKPLP